MDFKQQTKQTYDKIAANYNQSHLDYLWVDELIYFKSLINKGKIIDLGCGAGRDAIILMESGFDYTGIDNSTGMLKIAKERAPKGKFKRIDFSKTNFPDNTFDCFWAAASFLHLPKKDIAETLQETKRILKPNGIGFISIKEKTNFEEGMIQEKKHRGLGRYFSFFIQPEFKKILETNGFSIIKINIHNENDEWQTRWLCFFVKNIKKC